MKIVIRNVLALTSCVFAAFAVVGLAQLADALGEVTVEIPAEKVTSGLYYSIVHADNIGFENASETARSLATASGVRIAVPKIEARTQFFRIAVNLTVAPH